MKLFRKLTVLALAVLLVCALSASAFAANSDTQYQEYDTGAIVTTAWLTTRSLTGEICSHLEITEHVSGQIMYNVKRLHAVNGLDSVISVVYVDADIVASDSYLVDIVQAPENCFLSEATCRFLLTVTAYGGYYSYDQTSAVIYP